MSKQSREVRSGGSVFFSRSGEFFAGQRPMSLKKRDLVDVVVGES
jgi:hypothetical protein